MQAIQDRPSANNLLTEATRPPAFGTPFENPLSQHRCKSLILRGGICRSEDSEYICMSNVTKKEVRNCYPRSLYGQRTSRRRDPSRQSPAEGVLRNAAHRSRTFTYGHGGFARPDVCFVSTARASDTSNPRSRVMGQLPSGLFIPASARNWLSKASMAV